MIRMRCAALGAALLLVAGGAPLAGQAAADSAYYKLTISRDSLQALLAQLDSATDSASTVERRGESPFAHGRGDDPQPARPR